jgi:hypothetical protein
VVIEEPRVEVAGFINSSADLRESGLERPNKRRQKVPHNNGDPEEVQDQNTVDVAEVSRHILITDL